MKKWMALLLCCLLCLFVAGAMAEGPVTLSLGEENEINIYPDGYQEKNKTFVSYKGPYIITGESSNVDTCLDFYSIPHNASQDTEPVTYTVTFKDVNITAKVWSTAIRFGEGEGAGAKDITLNLINIGASVVKPTYNHAVFSNQSENGNSVTVNIHNTFKSSLELIAGSDQQVGGQTEWGVAGTKVTVNFNGNAISNDNNNNEETWNIADPCGQVTSCSTTPATCTSNGIKQHWKCSQCNMLFTDENGLQATTLSALTLPAQHALTLVPRKEPSYEQNGNIEYYRCTREGCGKLFADAEGKQELTPDDVVLPKLVRPDDLPPTGDTSNLALWIALLFISGGAAIGTTVVSRKKKYNR